MNLLILGLNHTTAPLSLREKLAFGPEELESSINMIRAMFGAPACGGIKEVAILSTCNRTEIYCAAEEPSAAFRSLQDFLVQSKHVSLTELEEQLYFLVQDDAIRHAFRVASGLDSMVLGETQIVGQMKKAVKTASHAGGLGLFLNQLFQKTYAVAKEVRSSTEIGAHSISLAAAAVRVANRIFGSLSESNILFIGAGEMIELCAAHFGAQNPQKVTVANRTVARAQALADQVGANAVSLAELPEILHNYDVVVSCTASTLPILGLGMVQSAVKKRRYRPIFMVDLAVPRDIEQEVSSLDEVYVYTVDDLGKVVQSGMEGRKNCQESRGIQKLVLLPRICTADSAAAEAGRRSPNDGTRKGKESAPQRRVRGKCARNDVQRSDEEIYSRPSDRYAQHTEPFGRRLRESPRSSSALLPLPRPLAEKSPDSLKTFTILKVFCRA